MENFQCQNPDIRADGSGWSVRFSVLAFSDGLNLRGPKFEGLLTVWPQGGIYFGIFFLACCTFFGLVFFFLKIWFRKCVWLAGLAFVVCGQVEGRRASGKLITILTTLSVRTVVVIRTHESHELWLTAALELNFNCRTCCPLDKYGGHMPNGQLIRGEISPSAVDGGKLSACLRFCSTIRAADYTQ